MGLASKASIFENVPYFAPDAIFDLTKKYLQDPYEQKVNLGQGTYRDETGQPYVLPSVKEAKKRIANQNHEYLPILGLPELRTLATELVLGKRSQALREERVSSCQSLSGTGALHLAALFLKRCIATEKSLVYVTEPTWSNHHQVFQIVGFQTQAYTYYDPISKSLDILSFLDTLQKAPEGSVLFYMLVPTTLAAAIPRRSQWRTIGEIMKRRNLFPLFDSAYLGISSGDYDADAYAIRYFTDELNLEVAICLSFAKNMGLYGERVGCVAIVTRSPSLAQNVTSVLEQLQRAEVSNPPAFGARIVSTILADADLRQTWLADLKGMSLRITEMRNELLRHLQEIKTPGDWTHIKNQSGMFCILGLSPAEVAHLQSVYHIYMAENSRISIAGMNRANVEYVARAIDETVRNN